MAPCWAPTPTTGCSAIWSSSTTSRPTSACLSTPPRPCCASAWPSCLRCRPCMAGTPRPSRRTRRACRSPSPSGAAPTRARCAAPMRPGQPELKGYWKFLGRVDLGSTRFSHAAVPAGTTQDHFDFAAYLHEAVGAEFDVAFEHIGFWDLRFMLADRYRQGRVFIAGDAAHSHPPYGGYGVNSGLEDARNLGWKLAATLQGWGGERLLDSYDAERRPVFASTINDFIARSIETDRAFLEQHDPSRDQAAFEAAWQARAQGAVGEVHAFEPHYEGSGMVWGSDGRSSGAKGSHRFEARPGHHLAPAALPSGRNVFEALGTGFSLLVVGEAGAHAGAVQAFREEAAGLGLPLTVVDCGQGSEPERYGAALILVRPDQFVSWVGAGASVAVARQALQRSVGAADASPALASG